MDLTLEDFKDSVDEIAMLYKLLIDIEPNYESEEEALYFNSPQYRSHVYRFINSLTDEQRDILNFAIIIGYWLCEATTTESKDYIQDINLQETHVGNIEGWCSKIISTKDSPNYLKTFLNSFLHDYTY